MARRVTDTGIQVEPPDFGKLKRGDMVFYWSPSCQSWIETKFHRVSSDSDDVVRLEAQKHANAKNVYVRVAASGASQEAAASGVAAAASGAPQAAAASAAQASQPNAEPQAEAAFGAMDVDEDEVVDETMLKEFQDNTFVPWLKALLVTEDGEPKGTTLAHEMEQALINKFGNEYDFRTLFRNKVPWLSGTETSYVKFQNTPRGSVKSYIHVSFLSYSAASYPGKGIYLTDAFVMLQASSLLALLGKTIQIRPRVVQVLSSFGWESDGAVVNGVISFIMSALVAWAAVHEQALPQPLARALGRISATYTKHENNQNRLLQSLVDSEAMRFANRTICDPIFLAQEFARCSFNQSHVKGFVRLYRQRTLTNAALAMPQRVEDATIRMMLPEKVARQTELSMIDAVAQYTWNDGPFTVMMILSAKFAIGSDLLTESTHETFSGLMKQSPEGQLLAANIYLLRYHNDRKRMSDDSWNHLLTASGVWAKITDKLLPLMMFNPELISTLQEEFKNIEEFRNDIVNLSSKEPPASVTEYKDLAQWVVQSVSRLRRAKEQFETDLRTAGDNLPSSIMANAAATELNHVQYLASIALDVNVYAKAIEQLEEEKETGEKKWALLKDQHIKDVWRFQNAMQQSECVTWQPLARAGLKQRREWILPAVEEAAAHRGRLKTIIGCKESDILQVSVSPLYHLGTLKKKQFCSKSKTHCRQ